MDNGKQHMLALIFNRLLLIGNVKNVPIDMQETLKYELIPIPLSMFTVNIFKGKSPYLHIKVRYDKWA